MPMDTYHGVYSDFYSSDSSDCHDTTCISKFSVHDVGIGNHMFYPFVIHVSSMSLSDTMFKNRVPLVMVYHFMNVCGFKGTI